MFPLGNIIRCHGLHFHCYANDVQLYISTNSLMTDPLCFLPTTSTTLGASLTTICHLKIISKTVFFHLKNIARLCPSLTFSAAETLIHTVITSRLDYCNSILYGTSSKVLKKLQYIQNSAARLLTCSCDHITPILKNLHWLPIQQQIQFKILLITYKALHNQVPSYLTDPLHPHTPNRSLYFLLTATSCPMQDQSQNLGRQGIFHCCSFPLELSPKTHL
ncbi:hypothetical protein LDENG_00261560 [Lucifuga dentata]|nr:hypothetical protein LDENG_00261560 [Lucifuga dentata]